MACAACGHHRCFCYEAPKSEGVKSSFILPFLIFIFTLTINLCKLFSTALIILCMFQNIKKKNASIGNIRSNFDYIIIFIISCRNASIEGHQSAS